MAGRPSQAENPAAAQLLPPRRPPRAGQPVLWLAVLSSSYLLQEADLDREEEPSPPFSLVATFKGSQLWE